MSQHLERIRFAPNIQQQIALKDPDGILCSESWGDTVIYETTDGKGLYVMPSVAAQINMLDLKPGEPFVIVKRWSGRRGDQSRWDLWRTGEGEKARAKEEDLDLEEQLRQSIHAARSQRKEPPQPAARPTPGPAPVIVPRSQPDQMKLPWAESVTKQSIALVDVYAQALAHSSEKHGNSVKPEDVRSLVITTYISHAQRGRGGFHAA